jgi:RND family efflux transporter MFP subunit
MMADFQIQENGLDKALRRRQTVDDRLSKTRVLAPFDGTVLEIPVSEGQVVVGAASVNSGTSLMTFADLSSLLIISQVNQLDAPKLSLGQELILKSPDSNESTASAKVQFIAPLASVKNNIKGFEVRGIIDHNDAQLKPGVSVSVRLALPKADGVVAVPLTAVFEHKGRKVAYVLENGIPVRREVTVGAIDVDAAEIQSGIREGEDVLLVEPPERSEKVTKKSRS